MCAGHAGTIGCREGEDRLSLMEEGVTVAIGKGSRKCRGQRQGQPARFQSSEQPGGTGAQGSVGERRQVRCGGVGMGSGGTDHGGSGYQP